MKFTPEERALWPSSSAESREAAVLQAKVKPRQTRVALTFGHESVILSLTPKQCERIATQCPTAVSAMASQVREVPLKGLLIRQPYDTLEMTKRHLRKKAK